MATPTLQQSNTGSDTIIAGYFQNGDDAHRAINALLDEGFLSSQIGAAFHTSGSDDLTPGDSLRQAPGRTFNVEAADVDTSAGGASSGTDAVQPVGLSSGSGSVILGAGNPGPIPGAELTHTGLPHELHSELAHDQPHSFPATTATVSPTPVPAKADTSWASRLKHIFQSKPSQTPAADTETFGTGAGALNLSTPYGQPYSRTAFESSVSAVGVPAEHSRNLSYRLSTGGAVVTASDTGRTVEVEKIFERYNGVVRFSTDIFDDAPALDYEPRVEVFGHLEHRYPAL
jgi:hypothetical protein